MKFIRKSLQNIKPIPVKTLFDKNIPYCLFVFALICFSCSSPNENSASSIKEGADSTVHTELSVVSEALEDTTNSAYKTITETVTVISVAEELIMPSDYLITAMKVKTAKNDTLVFLETFGFEKLVGQKIEIQYKMIPKLKLLVCSNCTTYNKPVDLIDITTFASEIRFEKMKLKEYQSDEYIVPASKFIMLNEDGTTEEYYSNEISLHDDTINLSSRFYNYGTTVLVAPELQNTTELESLLTK